METLYLSSSEWPSRRWTKEENKQFETALAMFDKDTPDRWLKVASMIPGKSELDVMKQFKELLEDVCDIEAGLVPIPGYHASPFSLQLVDDRGFDAYRKRSLVARGCDHERKKGVPWTEEEHRRFLMGLVKYGKGDWRNISRNFVVSKTPTQVASHAQKYFIRQHSGGKDKRRPSIHDITTLNLTDTTSLSHTYNPSSVISQEEDKSAESSSSVVLEWNQPNNVFFDSAYLQGNVIRSSSQPLSAMFQIQSARHQIHG